MMVQKAVHVKIIETVSQVYVVHVSMDRVFAKNTCRKVIPVKSLRVALCLVFTMSAEHIAVL